MKRILESYRSVADYSRRKWPDPQKWIQIEIEESAKISIKGGSTHERNPIYS